jgi:alcohol dehydrogenase class IV
MSNSEDQIERFFTSSQYPLISYGLPFPQVCAKHFKTTLECLRVYIIASGSLRRNTNTVDRLQAARELSMLLGSERYEASFLVSEVLEVAAKVEMSKADCIITLGGGSLIDAAKIILFAIANKADTIERVDSLLKRILAFSPIAKKVITEP